ncbi:hypothetical protein ANME2D_00456 [Candidatus Methanoperedens nitroreducens]|uniref:Uncharacterized protein n=1 Tax=Candidatus Methanoperedens nitratireducens TaxID=1392998 RepID=A0A062VDW6_9EURY|nr:protealysin inhibitor emfourin [Candidatus Methanoperedens nitroreducens]KCZ73390.1 hypothetical protein ANME2D_00456 [Candidatus Methanoperedens nitroreducens]MDJ1422656.1 hypothetical protein [Candidatus Methanoperedens sp.]
MLIKLERTGGFAGLRTAVTLDTDTLPAEEARKLHEMVDSAGFFNLPAKFPLPARGADYFVYRLTVEKDGRKHTVDVSDPAVPATLRPLLQSLVVYARK